MEGEGGERGDEDDAWAEETIVMFAVRLYSHDDATIKDWRYDHTAVPDSQIGKGEYQIPLNGWHDAGRKRKIIKSSHWGTPVRRAKAGQSSGAPYPEHTVTSVVANGRRRREF